MCGLCGFYVRKRKNDFSDVVCVHGPFRLRLAMKFEFFDSLVVGQRKLDTDWRSWLSHVPCLTHNDSKCGFMMAH